MPRCQSAPAVSDGHQVWQPRLAILFIISVCGIPAVAQDAGGPLADAREKYATLIETWAALQKELPGNLKRLPAAEATVKLEAAEMARLSAAKARHDYLDGLRIAYTAAATQFKVQDAQRNEIKDAVIEADQQLLSDLDQAAGRLEEELKAATSDRRRAAAVQSQKTELLEWRNLVLSRGRDLDRFGAELEQSSAGRETLSRAYSQLVDWVTSAVSAASKDDELWTSAYARLRRQIASQTPERPVLARVPVASPPPSPASRAAAPGVTAGGSILVPSVHGVWLLNSTPARRTQSGPSDPVSARIQINQTGNQVKGSFECTFALPPNDFRNPVVRFDFTGEITNPILRFEIAPPLRGTILLRQADAGTLELSYRIEGAKKSGIIVDSVSEQRPMVLQKALR